MEEYKRHRFGGLQYASEFYRNQKNIRIQQYQQSINKKQNERTQKIMEQNLKFQKATADATAKGKTRTAVQGLLTTGATTVDGFVVPRWAGHIKRFVKSKINKGNSGDVNEDEDEVDDIPNDEVPTAEYADNAPEYAQYQQPGNLEPSEEIPAEPAEIGEVTDLPPASEVPGLAGQPAPPALGTGRLGNYEVGMNDYDIANFQDPEFAQWTDMTNINNQMAALRQSTVTDDPLAPNPDGINYPSESTTSDFGPFRFDEIPDFLRNPTPPPTLPDEEEDFGPAPDPPPRVQSLRRRETLPEEEEEEDFGPAPDPPPRVQSLRRGPIAEDPIEDEPETGEAYAPESFAPESFASEDSFLRPRISGLDWDINDMFDKESTVTDFSEQPPDTEFPTEEELLAQEPTDLGADESTFFSRGLSRLFGLGSGRGGIAPEDMPRGFGPEPPSEEDLAFSRAVESKIGGETESYAEPEIAEPDELPPASEVPGLAGQPAPPTETAPPIEAPSEPPQVFTGPEFDRPTDPFSMTESARPADVEGEGAEIPEPSEPVSIPEVAQVASKAPLAEEGAEGLEEGATIGADVAEAGAEGAIDAAAVTADVVAGSTAAIPGLDIVTGAIGLGISAAAAGFSIYNLIKSGETQSQPKAPEPIQPNPGIVQNLNISGPSIAGRYVGAETDNFENATQHFSGF